MILPTTTNIILNCSEGSVNCIKTTINDIDYSSYKIFNIRKTPLSLIPNIPGLYILYISNPFWLYVGQTELLQTRISQHLLNKDKNWVSEAIVLPSPNKFAHRTFLLQLESILFKRLSLLNLKLLNTSTPEGANIPINLKVDFNEFYKGTVETLLTSHPQFLKICEPTYKQLMLDCY